jgi:hypothetical protein
MFKFWMAPKPNSFTWNEKARGEGTRASLHRRAILTARERFRIAKRPTRPPRARARATASDPPLPPSRDVTEIDHSGKFAARYLHRCTAVGVRLPPASLLARQPRRRPRRERRIARCTRVKSESDLHKRRSRVFFLSSFWKRRFSLFRARARSTLAAFVARSRSPDAHLDARTTRVSPTPLARVCHADDRARSRRNASPTNDSQDGNKILLFGGQGSGADFFNDLHLLDLQKSPLKLEQLHASGDPPFPRCSGTLTTVSVAGLPGTEVVALFGGSQGFFEGFSNSLCILQGDNSVSIAAAASQRKGLTWEEPRVVAAKAEDGVPDARWGHSAVAWRGKLILFGGSNTQHCFNDTWVLDVSHEPERSAPADAADAAGVGDAAESRDAAARARTSLPSGTTRKSSRLVATWSHVDICESARPPSRAGQTVSLVGDSLYVFGGCHISDVFNDLWTLDLSTQAPVWRELVVSGTPPAPRVGHAAVVLGDRIVFSGGRGSPSAGSSGTFATADQGLATMQGLTFFEGGFAMLDVSRRAWMPIQHPIRGGGGGALALTAPRDVVGVDVDLEMADAEHAEHAGASAPATAGGVGGAAPAEGGVWEHRTGHVMVPAKDGLLVIGGLAYNGEFQNDVQHIKVF